MADDLAQGLNLDQSLPIIKSMASEEARQKSESSKSAQTQILSQEGLYSKPAPDFKPSEESASGFAALGALLAASGAILGSGGKTSGLMAMNAVSGMMNGYNAGRKDLYEQERVKFEESMKKWERDRTMIKEIFDRAMKVAPTNLKLAQEMLNRDLTSIGQKPLAEMVQRSGPMPTAAAFYRANDNTTTKLNELSSVLGTAASRLPPDQKQYYDTLKTNQARVQFLENVAAQQAAAKKSELEQRKEAREEKATESLIAEREATTEAKKEAAKRKGLSEQDYNTAVALSKNPDLISTDRERDIVAAVTGTVYPVKKEPKADEVAGQRKFVRNFIGDEVKDLSPKEVTKVSSTIEAAKLAYDLADAIAKTPEAAGVVGKTLSFFDKYIPSRYSATDEANPDRLAAEAASDPSIFSGVPQDKISEVQKIQKMVVDVINARALAASGGGRMLISEFNAQKNVLGLGNLSATSARDVYRALANRDVNSLRQYGLSEETLNKINKQVQPSSNAEDPLGIR
jgi:hypothetical protein